MKFGKFLIELVPNQARNYCLGYNELKDVIKIAKHSANKEVTIQDVTSAIGTLVF
jgi:hypothetical protein